MSADLIPYLFHCRTGNESAGAKKFVFVFENALKNFGGLEGAFERASQNESGLDARFGRCFGNLAELAAAFRCECAIFVAAALRCVLGDSMPKQIQLHRSMVSPFILSYWCGMRVGEQTQDRILLGVAIAAAGLIHVSIAASQTLLGVGIGLLLVFRQKLEFPRIWIALVALFLWTALADVVSPDPWGGRAQIRKFFVFLFIPLVYGVFVRQFSKVFYLVMAWAIAATASGVWGLAQFVLKYERARHSGENFYLSYVSRRITGFESHWLTFGALQLSVLSLLLAQWFFSNRRMPGWVYGAIVILAAAILLSWDRSIWVAAAIAVIYLVWFWRRKMIIGLPVIAVLAFWIAPSGTRDRLTSLITPHGDTDSNRFRVVTLRTGIEMVKAHPWFGVGPEEIKRNFNRYVPADVVRPLPSGYYGHLHNVYVQYAAERGIPGLLLLLWFIGMTIWDCAVALLRVGRERTHERTQERFVLHGTIAVIIGVMVGGLAEYNLGDSEVLMMFVSVVPLGYAAVQNVKWEGERVVGREQVSA